jgi:virginiamycin B lyase
MSASLARTGNAHYDGGMLTTIRACVLLAPLVLQGTTITEYPLPRSGAFPHDVAVAKDGSVWYTDQRNSFIGHLDPATGKVTDIATPTPGSGPHGIVVAPDGMVWYTGNAKGLIGRLDPATGQIKEYKLPAAARDPHTPALSGGMLWFTVQGSNLYGWLNPSTGAVMIDTMPVKNSLPYGLVNGPDHMLYMAELGGNRIARIDPSNAKLTEFTLPTGAHPRRLAVDPQGIVWYTDNARGYLGRLDPATGKVREFLSPGGAGCGPYGIAIAPDGRIYYDETTTGHIVIFDPATEKMESVAIPTKGAIVRNMSVDSTRAKVWLALSGVGRLGAM